VLATLKFRGSKFAKPIAAVSPNNASSLNLCQDFFQPHLRKTQPVAFVRIESGKSSMLSSKTALSEEFRQKIDALGNKRIFADR
jgi:hypothetical protein